MSKTAVDPRVTKHRVTMKNAIGMFDAEGKPYTEVHQATDYVLPEHLEAYVADARLRWQHVEVSEEPDAGPGGYDGATHVPAALDHPEAGQVRPANNPED